MTLSPQRLEKAARVIRPDAFKKCPVEDCQDCRDAQEAALAHARAAISAYLGDTHVDVPREPTSAMVSAALRSGYQISEDIARHIYGNMVVTFTLSGDQKPLPWTPPFKIGDRVKHINRNDFGTVTCSDNAVVVEFDTPTSRGNISVGIYDENWFKQYPAGLVSAELTERDAG